MGEVGTYDQWLNNDIFGYTVEKGDETDSCWGFYGREYCMEEAKSVVDYQVKQENKKKRAERKNLLKLEIPQFFGI